MILRRNPYKKLEHALGYRFRRRRLLEHAVTHPSFSHEQPDPPPDNQRLEFLGDAALGLVAASSLYRNRPDAPEGALTKMRSALSSTKALADIARDAELGAFLRLGRGEERSGGRVRPTILADALEAVIGAAYLDGGLKAVERIFAKLFEPRLAGIGLSPWHDNPKGELQEWAQRRGCGAPQYRLVREEGPAHQRLFTVSVSVGSDIIAEGIGSTKREAETQAALRALSCIQSSD
jgi:ribonuclease-3